MRMKEQKIGEKREGKKVETEAAADDGDEEEEE